MIHERSGFTETNMDASIFLTAFGIVFVAEIIGDKSIYTINSLSLRLNTAALFLGLSTAFCLKMLVAVLIGQMLTELTAGLLTTVSAVTFFATAFVFMADITQSYLNLLLLN